MIEFRIGNLLESNAEALVNTVNTVSVMGNGKIYNLQSNQ